MRAVSYLRVSDPHQVKGDGFARQREVILAWALARKVGVVLEFREEGVSGSDLERPAMGKMFAFLQGMEGGLKDVVVLVERSDRLARDNLVSELLLREFRELGVRVIDCEADLDLTSDSDPSKVLIRQILQAVAQFEKASIVRKLRAARQRKRAKYGRCEGPLPFGSEAGERATLDKLRELRRQGFSCSDIARWLNRPENFRHYPTRRGRKWHRGSVHSILAKADERDARSVQAA